MLLVLLDEMSMLSCHEFGKLAHAVQVGRSHNDPNFGDVGLLLLGDFAQVSFCAPNVPGRASSFMSLPFAVPSHWLQRSVFWGIVPR